MRSNLTLSLQTTSVEFHHDPNSGSNPQPIHRLLSFFPCLTSLDMDCHYAADDLFPDSWCPPLRQLRLRRYGAVNMSKVVALLSAVCDTLEELHCDRMDEQLVLALTDHCRSLKKLSGYFHDNATSASIMSLCANSSHLITVDFNSSIITDELLVSILSACPAIRDVVLGEYCEIDPSELLSSPVVHALDSFTMRSFVFRMFPCESPRSKRCCEIEAMRKPVFHDGELPFLRSFSTEAAMLIRSITISKSSGFTITGEYLRMVAGCAMQKCVLYLAYGVQQADVQYFLSHCPNMVDLPLSSHGDRTLIDDTDMRNLPLWCPRIAKLELIACATDISDESLSCALEAWSVNSISVINLHGCRLLTDAVLPVIERYCPRLTSLSTMDTRFLKETLLQFVIFMAQNKVFCFLEADYLARSWIADELKTNHGAVWNQVKVVE